jgi:hypothetical protein
MLRGDDGFCRHQGHVTSLSSRDTHRFLAFFLLVPFGQVVGGVTTEEEDEAGRGAWRLGEEQPRRVVVVLSFHFHASQYTEKTTSIGARVRGWFCGTLKNDCYFYSPFIYFIYIFARMLARFPSLPLHSRVSLAASAHLASPWWDAGSTLRHCKDLTERRLVLHHLSLSLSLSLSFLSPSLVVQVQLIFEHCSHYSS